MLHILTSDAIMARPDFAQVAEKLLQIVGPRGALHLRSRALNGQRYMAIAERLAAASRASGALLVINSRVDIALASGAPAIQLGRGALSVGDVRRIAPMARIGVSIHTVSEAEETVADRPNWLIAGPIYPTTTHPGDSGLGTPFLERVVVVANSPVIAIGGIKVEHISAVNRAEAAGVAVISGIWDENDPKGAVIRYLLEYDDRGHSREHHPQR